MLIKPRCSLTYRSENQKLYCLLLVLYLIPNCMIPIDLPLLIFLFYYFFRRKQQDAKKIDWFHSVGNICHFICTNSIINGMYVYAGAFTNIILSCRLRYVNAIHHSFTRSFVHSMDFKTKVLLSVLSMLSALSLHV